MSSDLRRLLAPAWMALALQYGRFLVVGMAATAVHVSLYVGCVALLGMAPLLANAIGFALGVQVSYFGHGRWTFRDAEGSRLRFWIVSGVGFALNTLFVYGMFAGASDPSVKAWYKALTWLPFNLIASVLYFVFLVKLSKADEDCSKAAGGADKAGTNGALYVVLCVAMIAANWIAMFAA